MKKRYCLIVRKDRNGICYCHDLSTGKRESLGVADRSEAERIIDAKNQAFRNSHVNIQLARAFLFAADEKLALRTWDEVFEAVIAGKQGATRGDLGKISAAGPKESEQSVPLEKDKIR